ncbi:MAG: hypothetical protein R2698_09285 [Microthrixaceae bacterium]
MPQREILASFEGYFSRPIAPTRRIALGTMVLPTEGDPPWGPVLLGGIVARFAPMLDEDTDEEVDLLIDDLDEGRHVGQPRVRHRLQFDRIGLSSCRHRLVRSGSLHFEFNADRATPSQQVLGAVYAAATLRSVGMRAHVTSDPDRSARSAAFSAIRKGMDWVGGIDAALIRYLAEGRDVIVNAHDDPVGWARRRLGIVGAGGDSGSGDDFHRVVSRSFRLRLVEAHPDHGGSIEFAAERIAELREARRILLDVNLHRTAAGTGAEGPP